LGGLAACTDRGLPSAPAPASLAARVVICEANVRANTLACSAPSLQPTGRISADLVLGGQGTYVALRSSHVSYDGTTTFQADVTVQNLTVLPLGTSDGTTVSGVKVFFHSGPTVTAGTGTVTVANANGTVSVTGTAQPYFLYNQIIQTEQVSAAKTWQWSVPNTVSTFAFQVLVDAAAPQEHTVLRWLYDPVVDGADLAAVWSASASNAFAVGTGGKILHYDGTGWTPQPSPILADLAGVWGSSGTDVFAVGRGGTILHYDGATWSRQSSGATSDLYAVWGSSATDVYAVGNAGALVHYDGTVWRAIPSGTDSTQTGIWGSSASDIYVVAGARTILHYDGSSWSSAFTATMNTPLRGIWGASASDVFVAGWNTIVHYDGVSWTQQTVPLLYPSAIWGRSGTDVFAVGLGMRHYDGTSWTYVPGTPGGLLRGVWVGPDDVTVVGELPITGSHDPNPVIVSQYNGSQWTNYRWPLLTGIWASSGTNAFAVGQSGTILHYDGTAWRAESSGTDRNLADVWGTAANDVFAVGGGVILHYDGATWGTQLLPDAALAAVWGSSATDVYAVGSSGTLLHYDGTTWTQQTSGTSDPLLEIWGGAPNDIYAVGSRDSIWHYDAKRWTLQLVDWGPPPWWPASLTGVWGSAANNVFVVGTVNVCPPISCHRGVVARRCGGSWTVEALQEGGLRAIWGSSAADIYAVGDGGLILRRDGQGWAREQVPTMQTLNDVWGTPDGGLFAVGGGAILRGKR